MADILYNYYDILSCGCTDKKHKKSYGNIDKDEEPDDFVESEEDTCLQCGKKLKFKERRKITTTDEKVK